MHFSTNFLINFVRASGEAIDRLARHLAPGVVGAWQVIAIDKARAIATETLTATAAGWSSGQMCLTDPDSATQLAAVIAVDKDPQSVRARLTALEPDRQ